MIKYQKKEDSDNSYDEKEKSLNKIWHRQKFKEYQDKDNISE